MKVLTTAEKKLSLNQLKVTSFVTNLNGKFAQTIKGQGTVITCTTQEVNASEELNIVGSWKPTESGECLETSGCV